MFIQLGYAQEGGRFQFWVIGDPSTADMAGCATHGSLRENNPGVRGLLEIVALL